MKITFSKTKRMRAISTDWLPDKKEIEIETEINLTVDKYEEDRETWEKIVRNANKIMDKYLNSEENNPT